MASYDEAIPPGEAGKFRVTLHTGELRGKITRGITLTTNDPANRMAYLQVSARVLVSVELLPPGILLGGRQGVMEGKLVVRQDPTENGQLVVTELKTSQPWLAATVRRLETSEMIQGKAISAQPGDWMIEIRATEKPPWGPRHESLSFQTGLEREPEVEVLVKVYITPDISTNPRELFMPLDASGNRAEGVLLVTVQKGHESEPLSIEVTPDIFEIEIEQTGSRHYRTVVTWESDDIEAPRKGTATITLPTGTVEVPLQVLSQKMPANVGAPAETKK